MLGYIVRRLGMALITIWAISLISFIIIQLPPGDYITAYIAQLETQGTAVLEEEAESLRLQYASGAGSLHIHGSPGPCRIPQPRLPHR